MKKELVEYYKKHLIGLYFHHSYNTSELPAYALGNDLNLPEDIDKWNEQKAIANAQFEKIFENEVHVAALKEALGEIKATTHITLETNKKNTNVLNIYDFLGQSRTTYILHFDGSINYEKYYYDNSDDSWRVITQASSRTTDESMNEFKLKIAEYLSKLSMAPDVQITINNEPATLEQVKNKLTNSKEFQYKTKDSLVRFLSENLYFSTPPTAQEIGFSYTEDGNIVISSSSISLMNALRRALTSLPANDQPKIKINTNELRATFTPQQFSQFIDNTSSGQPSFSKTFLINNIQEESNIKIAREINQDPQGALLESNVSPLDLGQMPSPKVANSMTNAKRDNQKT